LAAGQVDTPWPAICVALSMCCVFGAAFSSFFAKLKLLIQYPEITWKLLLALLPHNTSFSSGVEKRVYRNWAIETERTILLSDYRAYILAIENF
jgi:hypothetical protein